ncbi:unnamed protein product [Protopolystoma xenopodis]|uniref:Uncharacterized protein n=1 Tax=Protopolystoma xenopodis TaxID=117903 RepID=A0A3S5CKQ5_9PLAT|nr:unnamed protein product [Protopolystoma xenopodis]
MKVMPIEPSTSVAAIKPDSHQASLKKHLIMKSGVMIQGAKVPGKTTNSIGTWHSDYATYEVAKVEQEESTCLNNESYAGDEEDENIPVGCHLGLERVECEQRRKAVQGIRNSKCDEDSASDFDNCRRHSEDVFPGVYDKHASKDEDKYEGPRHLMLYLLQAISETRLSTSSSCLFAPLTNYECSCRLPSQTTSGNRVNNTSLTPQMSSTLENESVKIQTSTNETAKSCHTYFCDTSSHIQEGEPAETRNDSMTFSAKDERHAAISHAPCSHPSSCSPSLLSCQFRSVLDSVLTIQQLDERYLNNCIFHQISQIRTCM